MPDNTPLRVGIVGANAETGWGRESHVPAVQRLDGLELYAVGTQTQATADKAAKAFGAKKAFGDALEMTRDPEVDIVSVVVRVPAHRELVLSALAHGKHVYCEWPLGRDTAETQALLSAAQAAGVKTAIGVQSRGHPAVRRAARMIQAGAIGEVLRARCSSTTAAWGDHPPEEVRYAEDPSSGVHLVSIQGAHTIDLAIGVLGPLADVTGLVSTLYGQIVIGDDVTPVARRIPDHLLLQARLSSGAPLGIEVAHVEGPDFPFSFEVLGSTGELRLTGGAPRGAQSGAYTLLIDGKEASVDEGELAGMPPSAQGVSGLYASLRDDIRNDTRTTPGFEHALALARLLDAVSASSADGVRRTAEHWPARSESGPSTTRRRREPVDAAAGPVS